MFTLVAQKLGVVLASAKGQLIPLWRQIIKSKLACSFHVMKHSDDYHVDAPDPHYPLPCILNPRGQRRPSQHRVELYLKHEHYAASRLKHSSHPP